MSGMPAHPGYRTPIIWISRSYSSWSRPEKISILILAFLVITYTTFFSAFQIRRQSAFENSLDTLSVEQPLWNTLHGSFLRATYYPESGERVTSFSERKTDSLLGDHIQPSLLVLLLPYALFPRTETLLVLLCLWVGAGAIPLYRIARRRLNSPWLALLFSAGYLFLPAVETLTGWDIHGAAFLPTLLLFALDAAETGHDILWWVLALLAMGFREDFPIFVGWAMIWMVPRRLRKQAYGMAGFGLLFSLVSIFVLIPHFGGGGTPYVQRYLPPGTPLTLEGIRLALSQGRFWWIEIVKFAVYNLRLGYPFLFLYFGSTSALLAMAPVLFSNGLSWYLYNLTPALFHYSSPLIAWAFVGSIDGFKRVTQFLAQRLPRINWKAWAGGALAVVILASHWTQGYTPLSRGFIWPDLTGRENAALEIIRSIPNDAAVSMEPHLASHFTQFKTVYLFPDVRDAQFILLDVWYGSYPLYLSAEDTQAIWEAILRDPTWETAAARDGLILLKKGSGPPQNISAAYLDTQPEAPQFHVRYGSNNTAEMVGISLVRPSSVEVTLCTDWAVNGTAADLTPEIRFVSPGNIDSKAPGDPFSLSRQVFTQPGRYRVCIRRMDAAFLAKQQAAVITLTTHAGNLLQIYQLEGGRWATGLKVQNNSLEVDLSVLH